MATHKEVAYNWANKTGRAKSGFNMYYEGDTIYSYGPHFPLARHITTPLGSRRAVLINDHSYSVSTSKHQTIVRQAINEAQGTPINVDSAKVLRNPDQQAMDDYLDRLEVELSDMGKQFRRARTRKRVVVQNIERTIYKANNINRLWQLKRPILPLDPELSDWLSDR